MREIEATLIICAEDPPEIVAAIAALSSVAGFPLLPQDPVSIHDYYVDTSDDVLRRSDFSLRLRESNQTPWLTLKGPPRPVSAGIVERLEIEVPWSAQALEDMSEELARHGVKVPLSGDRGWLARPAEALADLGLKMVQHRENYRQVRDVMSGEQGTGLRLAELSIDSVIYHLGKGPVRHYEVEIEAKAEGGVEVLPVVVQHLVEAFPSALQRWDHGKLSIGRAVEALLNQGELPGLLGDGNQLMPPAYPRVHQFLSSIRH